MARPQADRHGGENASRGSSSTPTGPLLAVDRLSMNIVASLIWYDESPAWLSATLHGIIPHIDHLVAIDGAYVLYPEARNWSRPDQHETILYSCQAAGIGLTLHTPSTVWFGNEVE